MARTVHKEVWHKEADEREIEDLLARAKSGDQSVGDRLGIALTRIPLGTALEYGRRVFMKDLPYSLISHFDIPDPDQHAPNPQEEMLMESISKRETIYQTVYQLGTAWIADHPHSRESHIKKLANLLVEWYAVYWPVVKKALRT